MVHMTSAVLSHERALKEREEMGSCHQMGTTLKETLDYIFIAASSKSTFTS